MFIVTAGFETTMFTAAKLIYHLFRNPEQLAPVKGDLSLSRQTVEETLRYEPGVLVSSPRWAVEDMEVFGVRIKRGDRALISNHAANHDE